LGKSLLHKKEATDIAKKLSARIEKESPHQNAAFYYQGKFIFEFGIRHGRKSAHGHLCGQNRTLRMTESEALQFARCHISLDDYVKKLKRLGVIDEMN
jgi:hypothetical protein